MTEATTAGNGHHPPEPAQDRPLRPDCQGDRARTRRELHVQRAQAPHGSPSRKRALLKRNTAIAHVEIPGEYSPRQQPASVPLVGRVAAGQLRAPRPRTLTATCPSLAEMTPDDVLFALKVRGDSMRDVGTFDGDRSSLPASRARRTTATSWLLLLDDEATVKRFFREKDHAPPARERRIRPDHRPLEVTIPAKSRSPSASSSPALFATSVQVPAGVILNAKWKNLHPHSEILRALPGMTRAAPTPRRAFSYTIPRSFCPALVYWHGSCRYKPLDFV